MTIHSVITQLETANHPVAQALHKGEHSKALIIGFKKGMELKDHSAKMAAKLLVLKGRIVYRNAQGSKALNEFEEIEIQPNEVHHVTAVTDSLCILIQG